MLVEDLWDSIVSGEYVVPIPQSHLEELERRLNTFASDPENILSLEELQSKIERRK